jgi:hypothetical protein
MRTRRSTGSASDPLPSKPPSRCLARPPTALAWRRCCCVRYAVAGRCLSESLPASVQSRCVPIQRVPAGAMNEAYGSIVNLAASHTPPRPPQRGAAGCHAKRRRTAAITDAAGRGGLSLCSAMQRVARYEGVDGNAHIRAEDRGIRSFAGDSYVTSRFQEDQMPLSNFYI